MISTPHMRKDELQFVKEAFDNNWIASVGPHVNAFAQEFCEIIGAGYVAAVSSSTAVLHLALQLVNVGYGNDN